MEQTLGIIKPDATQRNIIGAILKMIEDSNLKLVQLKKMRLTQSETEEFYAIHKERPFFHELVTFMCSDEIVVFVAAGNNAVEHYRQVIGSTNPAEAEEGTVRKVYGIDVEKNSVHGSDSVENAKKEINFFFG